MERPISPFEVVLQAFNYFERDRLSEDDLLRVCSAAHSPSDEVSRGVLTQMILRGLLTEVIAESGSISYERACAQEE